MHILRLSRASWTTSNHNIYSIDSIVNLLLANSARNRQSWHTKKWMINSPSFSIGNTTQSNGRGRKDEKLSSGLHGAETPSWNPLDLKLESNAVSPMLSASYCLVIGSIVWLDIEGERKARWRMDTEGEKKGQLTWELGAIDYLLHPDCWCCRPVEHKPQSAGSELADKIN